MSRREPDLRIAAAIPAYQAAAMLGRASTATTDSRKPRSVRSSPAVCARPTPAKRHPCWSGGQSAWRAWRPTSRGSTCRPGSAPACRFGHPVAGGVAIGLHLTHDELAGLCGTTRESVTRAMGQLVAQERVDVPKRGRIVVRHRLSAVPSCNRIRLHEPQ